MTRIKLADRKLPEYTKGEEIFNMTSHIVGGVLGITATVLCVVMASLHGNVYGIVSGAIYGFCMIFLYSMSSIYHGLSPKLKGKKVMQILDHCAIFLLIAGSYTPFALCTLMKYNRFLGWSIFGIIWLMAIIGIVLNAIDLKKYKKFSMICYIVMGWCIVFRINILLGLLGNTGFILLLLGGIIYTIGAIIYAIGKKRKFMHSIFHLCVLLGSLLQFFCILFFVM